MNKQVDKYAENEATKKAIQSDQVEEEGELSGAVKERTKLLVEDREEEEIKDFGGDQTKMEQAAEKEQWERINSTLRPVTT